MIHDFNAMRKSYGGPDPEPLQFTYASDHVFTVNQDPTLGDALDIALIPGEALTSGSYNPSNPDHITVTRQMVQFIGRMLVEDINPDTGEPFPASTAFQKWLDEQYVAKAREAGLVWDIYHLIYKEVVSSRPSEPSTSLLAGRGTTGPQSSASTDGTDQPS